MSVIAKESKIKQTLSVGDLVRDTFGDKGIVVKIKKGVSDSDHGTVHVWQLDKIDYGADNCEHYPEFNWQSILKIIKKCNPSE